MTEVYVNGRRWEPPSTENVLDGFGRLAVAIRPRLARRTAPTTLAVLRAVATIGAEHRTFRPVASIREIAVRAQVGHDTAARHLKILCSPDVRALAATDTGDRDRDLDGRKPGVGRARAYAANELLCIFYDHDDTESDVNGYDHTLSRHDAQKSVVACVNVTAPPVLRHRTGRGPLHGLVVGALGHDPVAVADLAQRVGCTRQTAVKHLLIAETDGTAQRVPAGRHDRWVAGERDLAGVEIAGAEAAAQRQAERYRLDRQGFAKHRDRVLNARARNMRSRAA